MWNLCVCVVSKAYFHFTYLCNDNLNAVLTKKEEKKKIWKQLLVKSEVEFMANVNHFEVACKCGHVWFMWVRLLSPENVEASFRLSRVRCSHVFMLCWFQIHLMTCITFLPPICYSPLSSIWWNTIKTHSFSLNVLQYRFPCTEPMLCVSLWLSWEVWEWHKTG